MISTEELIDLLETEGSIDYLFLEYGLTTDELEDRDLADLIDEALPILDDINSYIERERVAIEAAFREED